MRERTEGGAGHVSSALPFVGSLDRVHHYGSSTRMETVGIQTVAQLTYVLDRTNCVARIFFHELEFLVDQRSPCRFVPQGNGNRFVTSSCDQLLGSIMYLLLY